MSTQTVPVPQEVKMETNEHKTSTDWSVFEKAGLLPARVKHDGYLADDPSDLTCNTTIVPTIENVLRHIDPDHGVGWFRMSFDRATSTPVHSGQIWKRQESS